jgi:hypothetical protein
MLVLAAVAAVTGSPACLGLSTGSGLSVLMWFGPWASALPAPPGFSPRAGQAPARVKVTWVTPLGEDVASIS